MQSHDNSTAQVIANGAAYVKIINFANNDPANLATPDFVNNEITTLRAGIYRVEGAFSFTAANNKTFFGGLFVDGSEIDGIHFTRKIGTSGDVGNASFTGLVNLTADQVIDFRIRHDDVAPVSTTFSYMNLNMTRVGV